MATPTILILLSTLIANICQAVNPINVIFIWFDDLGFGDTGYNGATYPTPILDNLANNDAIKINFHYAEQVCTASRTALLTGRYSWLTGINSVVQINTGATFDTSLTLFPQLLNQNRYNTFIAGKWHIGYSHIDDLPLNRGFKQGLYSHFGLQYYTRTFRRSWARLDEIWGDPSNNIKQRRNTLFGANYNLKIHDTFRIANNGTHREEVPEYVYGDETNSYGEDLYTEAIKEYIAGQRGRNPFFVYYSQWTPHANLVQPPSERRDGSIVDYSACYDAFPDRSEPECSLANDTRCIFCKQVHYASLNIEEIIDEVKANPRLDWNDTVVIITSDNGAAPTALTGYAFGSALPYRGVKSGTHEGGIRTPAIIKGGYIESILRENPNLNNNMCNYNEMVHISDWYDIIMSIANITDDYTPDSDHDSIDVWGNIRCRCKKQRRPNADPNTCDSPFPPRNELIQMRMCGDPNGSYANGDKFFYSAYVRKGDWKLVINGSNSVTETCDNITDIDDRVLLTTWQEADGSVYAIPNETYYNESYAPRFSHNVLNPNLAATLYQSECLEDLVGDPSRNNPNLDKFQYSDQMLFDIGSDKVEACLVFNATKKQELFSYLIERSKEYTVSTEPFDVVMGSFRAQMGSYDCNATYTRPWNGNPNGALNTIWDRFLKKEKNVCQARRRRRNLIGLNDENEYDIHHYEEGDPDQGFTQKLSIFVILIASIIYL